MSAFYQNSVRGFLTDSEDSVRGALIAGEERAGFSRRWRAQTRSWSREIEVFRAALWELCDDIPEARVRGCNVEGF